MSLGHHIFSKGRWRKARFLQLPRKTITISVLPSNYRQFGRKCPDVLPTEIDSLTNSGAQADLWSLSEFLSTGFTTDDLIPVSIALVAANKSPISVDGAIVARMKCQSTDGWDQHCATMVYISKQA